MPSPLERCLRCGFRESDISSVWIPPHALVEGQDVFNCLRSGNSSFDIDVTALDEDITLQEKTVSDLNHRLKHLDALISRIRKERAKTAKNLAAKRSLLSPIRRLNRDVLLHIFSYVSDWKFNHNNTSSSLDVKNAPWIFLRVCHWWRLIASSSPALWSTVSLVKVFPSFLPPHALDIVRSQLQLSRDSPLKLLLYCDNPDGVNEEPLIKELVSHSSRWFSVYIRAFAPVLRQLSAVLETRNLSELKTLTLEGFRQWEFDSNVFFDAPNLTSLRLDYSCRVLPSMFPTSNLSQFRGSFYDGAEFRNFISAAPRLEVLWVQVISGRQSSSANQPAPIPITLHHLRQLSYLRSSETCTEYLTVPALRILSATQSSANNINAIAALYDRSRFSLDQLYLCRSCTCFAAAAHFFETDAVRHLMHLHLEVDTSSASDWITALTVTSSSCVLPNLSDLTVMALIFDDSGLTDPDQARRFLDMARSRLPDRAGVNSSLKSCLKNIKLLLWEPFDARDIYIDGFKALREGGLDANFHFSVSDVTRNWLWHIGPMICSGIELF
ncbi:hypothetical protein EV421DRAFT_594294 [Armillaria borealis]|uniref:F-box domain-containing protein n=1 Tax=Armillaria borealis TaxID=47425 RepID=A0AA39JHX7_9AGAR|nr:hypothetical protein EV421DRAFT_594294 [Armillaria borealis]